MNWIDNYLKIYCPNYSEAERKAFKIGVKISSIKIKEEVYKHLFDQFYDYCNNNFKANQVNKNIIVNNNIAGPSTIWNNLLDIILDEFDKIE